VSTRDLLGRVKVEVEADPVGLPNMLDNVDGVWGSGYGWSAVGKLETYTDATHGPSFKETSTGGFTGSYSNLDDTMRVATAPGEWVSGQLHITGIPSGGGVGIRVSVVFVDAAGTSLATNSTDYTTTGVKRTPAYQAPAGTKKSRLHIRPCVIPFSAITMPPVGTVFTWRRTMLTKASTAAPLQVAYAFVDPDLFTDLYASASEIKINREGMDVGTLEATFIDAALDTATSTALRRGRRVRASVQKADGVWERLFTGRIDRTRTRYLRDTQAGTERVRVELMATDAWANLANLPPAYTVGRDYWITNAYGLPWQLEGAGVPFDIDGTRDLFNDNQATVKYSRLEGSSLPERLAITRDSEQGRLYIKRDGVLWFRSNPSVAATATLTDSPAGYAGGALSPSSLEVDTSSDLLINQLTVKVIRGDGSEAVYGPYSDSASVAKWGQVAAEASIIMPNETQANVDAYAAAVLAANATPVERPRQVRVPVKDLAHVGAAATRDLGDVLTINYGARLASTYRVESIEHHIRADAEYGVRWVVTMGFDAPTAVAAPAQAPAAGAGAASGPQAGVVASGALTANTNKLIHVDFPTPYAAPPVVTLQIRFGAAGVTTDARVQLNVITASGFDAGILRVTGTASMDVHWHAIPAT
jgi:hypothetical protein